MPRFLTLRWARLVCQVRGHQWLTHITSIASLRAVPIPGTTGFSVQVTPNETATHCTRCGDPRSTP